MALALPFIIFSLKLKTKRPIKVFMKKKNNEKEPSNHMKACLYNSQLQREHITIGYKLSLIS